MKHPGEKNENTISIFTQEAILLFAVGLVGYFISTLFGWSGDLKTIIVGSLILVGALVFSYLKKGVKYISDDLGKVYTRKRTGIIKIYEDLNQCKEDMQEDFRNANDIRMLLQIGRKEYGDGESSFFWSLAQQKHNSGTKIRILRASTDSPFLSDQRAKVRNTPVKRWQEDIRRLASQIDLLKESYNCPIEDREHSEPFLWRILLFDNVAYVSGYLHNRHNDRQAFVYKLEERDDSLYIVFSKYFDYLWEKYNLSASLDPTEKWANWQ